MKTNQMISIVSSSIFEPSLPKHEKKNNKTYTNPAWKQVSPVRLYLRLGALASAGKEKGSGQVSQKIH